MEEKTERIGLVTSKSDKRKLKALARMKGESCSLVIRQLIREAAQAAGVEGDLEQFDELPVAMSSSDDCTANAS